MTIDDARQLIQKNISSGFVDPRTHEHTCRKVVTYYQEHTEEQDVIRQALVEVISEYEWVSVSAEQLENAAYITVNLESAEALQNLVTNVVNLDEPSDNLATIAIAAIRSFPGNGAVRDLFFPALFRWLRSESVAHLAFEALCELSPDDAGAYLSALSHYHRSKPDVIQKALTHLYYRGGDTVQGASDVRSVVENFAVLVDSIKMHPFFPDTFKRDIEKEIRVKTLFANLEEANEMLHEINRGLNLDSNEVAEIFNNAIENTKHEMQKVAEIKRRRKALENLDENA